jgi:hypothetical protein
VLHGFWARRRSRWPSLRCSRLTTEAWEDPYLVGTPRLATERDSNGVRLDWWRIFGTGFFAQLQSRDIEFDTEASGTDPSLGLTADEIRLLRLDGADNRATLGYRWETGRHTWQPEFAFTTADRDGDAIAAEAATLKLSYGYRGEARKLDFGNGDWRAFASVVHADNDSDVDFHDSSAFAASLGLAYFFGR